jgi:hypothetical protein
MNHNILLGKLHPIAIYFLIIFVMFLSIEQLQNEILQDKPDPKATNIF